jgi:hypothetical protein
MKPLQIPAMNFSREAFRHFARKFLQSSVSSEATHRTQFLLKPPTELQESSRTFELKTTQAEFP